MEVPNTLTTQTLANLIAIQLSNSRIDYNSQVVYSSAEYILTYIPTKCTITDIDEYIRDYITSALTNCPESFSNDQFRF